MLKPKSKDRYPIVHIHLDDLDYLWGHVKIRSADYKNYLMQVQQEYELINGIADKELTAVYNSIKKKGLINPLIVTQHHGRFFVIVGCQRLAALRVMNYKKLIPCRISADFDESAVLAERPYKKC